MNNLTSIRKFAECKTKIAICWGIILSINEKSFQRFTFELPFQAWTPSLQDSNADGQGDINGVKDRLEDLRRIGVKTIWPTPLLQTSDLWKEPYSITELYIIDSGLGTNDEFKSLVDSAHSKGSEGAACGFYAGISNFFQRCTWLSICPLVRLELSIRGFQNSLTCTCKALTPVWTRG